MPTTAQTLMTLDHQLRELESLLQRDQETLAARITEVSGWSILQQADHQLQVLDRVTAILMKKKVIDAPAINARGRMVLFAGRIPRGRAEAPQAVRPAEASPKELLALVGAVRERLTSLAEEEPFLRERAPYFRHVYFGGLTPAQTLRFLAVHTDHHARIIEDIFLARRDG